MLDAFRGGWGYAVAMLPAIGARPRLGDHVAVRQHHVDGEVRVVLTRIDGEGSVVIGAREWDILRCADGTRDVAGVLLAAAARGRHSSETRLRAFLAGLGQAGMLREGPAAQPAAGSAANRTPRPLLQLPDYQLHCDGAGTCCRLYPTTTFSLPEASRARGLLPLLNDAGVHEARMFTPRRGAQLLPWQSRAVTMHNGRCGYLDAAGLCRLHSAAGAAAKPQGCQLFPLTFVDDGTQVRVSVAPECSCAYRSAAPRPAAGAALLPQATSSDDLPAAAWIEPARSEVWLTATVAVPHRRYAALRDALLAELEGAEDPPRLMGSNLPRLMWALAEQLAAECATTPGEALVRPAALLARSRVAAAQATEVPTYDEALVARLERLAAEQRRWRSGRDFGVQALQRLAQAARAMRRGVRVQQQPIDGGTAADALDERFYLRAIAFGDLWLREHEPPLVEALRQRARRMGLGRALRQLLSATEVRGRLGGSEDAAWAHPLALCEALLRSHGVEAAS